MLEKKDTKVLIVEDDYLVTDMIRRTLTELGYTNIDELSNGREAIEKACIIKPDIILMDIEMPEINGIDACQKIQEICPTPVIILTAFETDRLVKEAAEAGVSAYLVKPLKKYLVERTIVLAIARHKDLMEIRRLHKEIKVLKGVLPICSNCKNIRNDKGIWTEISEYIAQNSEAGFSHGVCPNCMEELYGKENWFEKIKK